MTFAADKDRSVEGRRGEAGRANVGRHLDERLAVSIEDYEYLEEETETDTDFTRPPTDRGGPP